MSKDLYEKMKDTIPIDTGGLIRVGILDLTRRHGPDYLIKVLKNIESSEGLGTDTQDLMNVAINWDKTTPLEMESGTLFRILWFYFNKNNIERQIVPVRTLVNRVEKMSLNPEIKYWPLAKLGTLEGGTTQYQTAAILMGNNETLDEVPFYIKKTYNIRLNWENQMREGKHWSIPKDPTLITQCEDYINYLKTGTINTKPDKLGDCDLYCFFRAFDAVSREWGEKNWPQLAQHESSRFQHTDDALKKLNEGKIINSNDHRVVEAGAMIIQARSIRGNYAPLSTEKIKERFSNPGCVAKKWPRFWEAMDYSRSHFSKF